MNGKEPADPWSNTEQQPPKKKTLALFRIMITLICVLLIPCCVLLLHGLFVPNLPLNPFSPSTLQAEAIQAEENLDMDKVENGIHLQTGLVFDEGFQEVRATCTACHSAKLVTQNRATREGWKSMIVWMQETQGLWELGAIEPLILDYLSKHYAPQETSRRENLDMATLEWYILELE